LRYLGWGELEDGFRLVEWPDRSPSLVANADLVLHLDYADAGRGAELSGLSERGRHLVAQLEGPSDTQPQD
jgi:tRNA A37 threonylcarbamoyladenosine biosynthesis protein TsaE